MLETRALVVDDDPLVVEAFGVSLRKMVRHVDEETDGGRALELFTAYKHAIVILDLIMPRLNGIEVLRQIHLLEPRTQVIIVTGFASKQNAIEALNLHAFGFLEKPISYHELHQLVTDAFARYQGSGGPNSPREPELEGLYSDVARLSGALERSPEDPGLQAAYRESLVRLRSAQTRDAELASRAFRENLALKKGMGYASIEAARRVLDRDKDSA